MFRIRCHWFIFLAIFRIAGFIVFIDCPFVVSVIGVMVFVMAVLMVLTSAISGFKDIYICLILDI